MKLTNRKSLRHILILSFAVLFVPSLAWGADDPAEINKRLAASAKVLDDVMASPNKAIPDGVIKRATCVAVFPATVQVAVLVGAKHGKGFVTCRTSGSWSAPAPLDVAGGSWGAQLGGQEVDLVLVVTNEKGLQQIVSGKTNLGTETSVTAGPVGNHEWKMNEDVLTYARARGVFAGFNLAGSAISQDEDDTRKLYGSSSSLNDILTGKTQPPEGTETFLRDVEKYAGRTKAKD